MNAAPAWGFRVRVLDATTGRPVANALVGYGDRESLDLVQGARRRRHAMEIRRPRDLLGRLGQYFRCDAEGETRVPYRARGKGIVTAHAGERFAIHEIDDILEPEPLILRVSPSRTLQVRVNQPDGQPAVGAPASLQIRPWYAYHPVARARSGSDGIAHIPHVDKLRLMPNSLAEWIYPDRWALPGTALVRIDTLQRASSFPVQFRDVALGAVSLAEPQLTLGPTGQVRVSVRAAQRQALPSTLRVAVCPIVSTESHDSLVPVDSRCEQLPATGQIAFPYVALGKRLMVEVWMPGEPTTLRQEILGPSHAEDVVQVHLQWSPRPAVVTGIAVDADGQRLRQQRLHLAASFAGETAGQQGGFVRTDSNGVFRIPLAHRSPATLSLGTLDVHTPLHGTAATPRLDRATPHDLGPVRFRTRRRLAHGVVVDPRGQPIAGARVWLERQTHPDEGDPFWEVVFPIQGIADGRGRFALFAPEEPPESGATWRVAARGGGWARAHASIQTDGSLIKLSENTASWTLPIQAPQGFDTRHLRVFLVSTAPTSTYHESVHPKWSADYRSLTFFDLDPGRYEVGWDWVSPEHQLDFASHKVTLKSGGNQLPGLPTIDLRSLRELHFEVRDAKEQLVPEVEFAAYREDDCVGAATMRRADGHYNFWVPHDADTVTVFGEGHATRELRQFTTNNRVSLELLSKVRFMLKGIAPLPKGYALGIALRPTGHWVRLPDSTRQFEFAMPGPQKGVLKISLERGNSNAELFETKVEILDQRAVQVIEVKVPQAALEAALRKLR